MGQHFRKPLFILAPMVDNSGLEWRKLARKYGSDICYTEMVHCNKFLEEKSDININRWYMTDKNDRPLAIQICGNDQFKMSSVAEKINSVCELVDINFGCPQNVAKRGRYGAFLQDDWKLTSDIVRSVSGVVNKLSRDDIINEIFGDLKNIQNKESINYKKEVSESILGIMKSIENRLSCKIRIFKDKELTLKYCEMIQSSGCGFLVVHGRTRDQKGEKTGLASWDHIKLIKEKLRIPVISNGNILYHEDVRNCLDYTGSDGVMVAETHLYNPLIFTKIKKTVFEILYEYYGLILESKNKYQNLSLIGNQYLSTNSYFKLSKSILFEGGSKMCEIRSHTFKLLHKVLLKHKHYYSKIGSARNLSELMDVIEKLKIDVGDDKFYPEPYIR
ncbi:tRNA-dihydrouridine(16/17) synthase [NAD(P)(+)]-like [Dictyocoela muelleri]|nr:tRNA-dihydrouridine(16/17) synthase [NAD(P)(+)]-like [Dictyocoela muelleri]